MGETLLLPIASKPRRYKGNNAFGVLGIPPSSSINFRLVFGRETWATMNGSAAMIGGAV